MVIDKKKQDIFFEVESAKIIESIQATQNLRVQMGIFFGTANLTGLGIAFTFKSAILIFVTAFTMVNYAFLDLALFRMLIGYCYRGLILKSKVVDDKEDTFIDAFILHMHPKRVA